MRERSLDPLLSALVLAAALLVPSVARAEENLLHGPHPFLKDNELSVHVLIGEGQGDALSRRQAGARLWLQADLRAGALLAEPARLVRAQRLQSRAGRRRRLPRRHRRHRRDHGRRQVEVRERRSPGALSAGRTRAWCSRSPTARRTPRASPSRAAGGANYFFFDWLGLGAQVGFSLGRIDYDATFTGSHTYVDRRLRRRRRVPVLGRQQSSALRCRRRSWAWRRSGCRRRSAVTRMSSSMRTPRPRNSAGAAASSAT